MPIPNGFPPQPPKGSLAEITGGLTAHDIAAAIDRGARFVVYQFVISALIITIRRNSRVVFVRPGQSTAAQSLPYTMLTFFLGWWGFPFGLIYTPMALYKNLSGGTDITETVRQKLGISAAQQLQSL